MTTNPPPRNAAPSVGQLWADQTGDEWLIIIHDGAPWLARPVADIDLSTWHLAAEAEGPVDAEIVEEDDRPLALDAFAGMETAMRDAVASWRTPVADPAGGGGTEGFIVSAQGRAIMAQRRGAGPDDVLLVSLGDGPPRAVCPHCGVADRIAELDAEARINPILFARGIDNDNLYFTVVTSHSDVETQRYLCRACRATVTIPADISITS